MHTFRQPAASLFEDAKSSAGVPSLSQRIDHTPSSPGQNDMKQTSKDTTTTITPNIHTVGGKYSA